MKKIYLLYLVLPAFIMMASCKKSLRPPSASTPVSFAGTAYDSLGTYDKNGKPDYLITPDVISDSLSAFVKATLPEDTNVTKTQPQYFNTEAQANIVITTKSVVYVTFVSEGSSYLNTIGFYKFLTSNPPLKADSVRSITYIFPNATVYGKGGELTPGDKVNIGTFLPGTSIGFVLMANAWKQSTATASGYINTNAPHYLSQDQLNPENDPTLKRHAILIPYPPQNITLIGFEDLDRTSASVDNDFNDVVIYATVVPTN